ncbi:MAG: hypothetical protein AB7O26_08080 [Planctomycetaceae bacterium]
MSMDFDKRLERAIVRGEQARDTRARAEADKAMTDEQFRALHSKYRLETSEYIETNLQKLADHFPGFRFQSVIDEGDWGGRITRDDLNLGRGRAPNSQYSRLEILVRPFSSLHVIELNVKASIRNKEVFNRMRYQMLNQFDPQIFTDLIDLWILEYAEMYAAEA